MIVASIENQSLSREWKPVILVEYCYLSYNPIFKWWMGGRGAVDDITMYNKWISDSWDWVLVTYLWVAPPHLYCPVTVPNRLCNNVLDYRCSMLWSEVYMVSIRVSSFPIQSLPAADQPLYGVFEHFPLSLLSSLSWVTNVLRWFCHQAVGSLCLWSEKVTSADSKAKEWALYPYFQRSQLFHSNSDTWV